MVLETLEQVPQDIEKDYMSPKNELEFNSVGGDSNPLKRASNYGAGKTGIFYIE